MTPSCEEPRVYGLGQVVVRLIEPWERERFDQMLVEKHYLHSARVGGRSLRYVAELKGEWVALICFSGAAPHVKAREKWIGWSVRQRARRLGFVVNNSRFLVLTERHAYPNLASRVLGLCLKTLDTDWRRQWDQPVLLVESFVDESHYRGTCYRACGFAAVGLTAGYGRSSRDYYLKHDQPKQLFLRPLRKDAAAILHRGRLPAELAAHEEDTSGPCPLRAEALGSLLEAFHALGDQRRGHGLRHPQPFVLACATVGMLMGAGGYEAMEDQCAKLTQRQLRALGCRYDETKKKYRPPSDSTFFRVINQVDPVQFDLIAGQWMMGREISILERLAVDGKTLRGSGRTDGKALQLLSAVSHRLRLTVAQLAIEEKSNEIPAFQPLLETIPRLEGSIVTADAMQCQQEAARYVTQQRGADYLFGLKGNQEGILERATVKLPSEFFSPEHNTGWSKEHGRLERCRLQRKTVTPEEAGLCGCWQFIAVWRERHYLKAGKVVKQEQEYAYYVTSAEPSAYDAAALLGIIRGHWNAVENGSHHRRDVTLREDASRITKGAGRHGAHVMATLRNIVLGLFEWQKDRGEVQGYVPRWRRKMDGKQAVALLTRTA